MVLIAATAIGGQALRSVFWEWTTLGAMIRSHKSWTFWEILLRIPHALNIVAPIVAAWTVALLVLRLCPPRPPRRRLGSQPGMVACAGATLGLVVLTLDTMIERITSMALNGNQPVSAYITDLVSWPVLILPMLNFHNRSGLVVAGAWLALAIGGRWRPEPTWIDRAGRAVGIYWILMIPWIRLLEALMMFKIVTIL